MAADRACDLSVGNLRMLDHVGEYHRRFDNCSRKPLQMSIATHDLDPAENLLRRLLPELRQLRQLAFTGDPLEIIEILNAECVVNQLDSGRSETGHLHQIQHAL